jgi:hypothetical protein
MKSINIKKLVTKVQLETIIIILASFVLTSLLISFYFTNHFFFHTIINGVDVSLKKYDAAEDKIRNYAADYKLRIIDKYGETDVISGQKIELYYNEDSNIASVYDMQNSLYWVNSLFTPQTYSKTNLFLYNKYKLNDNINALNCLTKEQMEPRNVKFNYTNGAYEVIKEEYGNKIIKDRLLDAVMKAVLNGHTELNLEVSQCYEEPRYTLNSDKTKETRNLLNKYVSTRVTYTFGEDKEVLDGTMINKWLIVDENLDVKINESAIMNYMNILKNKYDTVGIARNFKTSTGKTVEVTGGLYGWKIDKAAEAKALLEHIERSEMIEKEPIYSQKALPRGENEIGNTYVEINITRQHLWFYKDGKLICQGDVVTGNPNRGNATVLGIYMLNYKQKNVTIAGVGYSVKVIYWMPFYGNIGMHDASWRYSFGGKIYKSNGTHGCVNLPKHLAKTIFENIEEGYPVICYEE